MLQLTPTPTVGKQKISSSVCGSWRKTLSLRERVTFLAATWKTRRGSDTHKEECRAEISSFFFLFISRQSFSEAYSIMFVPLRFRLLSARGRKHLWPQQLVRKAAELTSGQPGALLEAWKQTGRSSFRLERLHHSLQS